MFQEYLFDTPYWLLGLLGLLGICLILAGITRRRRALIASGVAAFVVAGVLVALSHFVQTPRKLVMARTRQAIAAVSARDMNALQALLDPQVRLYNLTREDILERTHVYADEIGLRSVHIDSMQIRKADEDRIEEDISVTSNQEGGHIANVPGSFNTKWRLIWYNSPAGWRIGDIQPLPSNAIDAGVMDEYLHK